MKSKEPKIGLVLCECGNNIAGAMDLDAVEAWAGQNDKIAFTVRHNLLCSPAGKKYFEDLLNQKKPGNVVIAACSPRMHDATFKSIASKTKTNQGKVHMANIREQSAWVTPNKEEATQKAIALINAAVERCLLHDTIEPRSMKCNTDVVVIGGGIAGIEAALLAAQGDHQVTIIEKNISLGGRTIQTEELAPRMECAACLLAPRLEKLKDHPKIRVIANAEVTDVLGFYGNFTVKGTKQANFVRETCIGCEACFDVCPVAVKSEFHANLGTRKAVYTLFPGSVPPVAAIDRDNCKHFIDGSCDACVSACPFQSIDFSQKDESFEITTGAVIVATGPGVQNPDHLKQYGYGTLDNVYTLLEFERLASSNGPTMGSLKLSNGEQPRSVAVIHCAGSLTRQGLPYCSGTCCTLGLKVGDLTRKQLPETEVYNIHDRLVFPQPDGQHYLEEQINGGTHMIRTPDLQSVRVQAEGGRLRVTGQDMTPLTVDMVVLATGFGPTAQAGDLAKLLNLETTAQGFFTPDHYFIRSMAGSLDGIYVVGGCASPGLVPQSVNQAQAAAGEAVSRLVPGRKIELECMTTRIDSELCAGCKMCVSVCPYTAVRFDEKKGVCEINEAICRGCGTCAANCPSHAASAKHFTNRQIMAELEGILK